MLIAIFPPLNFLVIMNMQADVSPIMPYHSNQDLKTFSPMDNNYDDLSKNEKKLLLIHYASMVADNFLCKDMKRRDDVI